ncbi:hypothetical protein [Haloplanus rubicundus]|uniref:Uncharacterized protein n=1 Tax=Haloplanus rubicundus TaxID=1547898 RepID=A0A345EHB9_9EURY|nr:hypothetical protein [Haloplanus rubicundus]AXG11591.1 hypothetical protein DU484_17970 [Haloplanus rubicundus]
MTQSSDSGATAEDETPRGAPKPEELDGREDGEESGEDIPPEAREEKEYDDEYVEAREIANPDQHRDDEAYD